jgi:Ca2+-binding EF-hand superfamily protein
LETLQRLARLLAFIGEQEQNVEFARQNLCRLSSFEPYAAFQRFDRGNKGFVTAEDVARFMR